MRLSRRARAGAVLALMVGAVTVVLVPAAGADDPLNTVTTSTEHVTTIQTVELPDAPAPACGTEAVEAQLVGEESEARAPTTQIEFSFGPGTIYVGENRQTPFVLVSGQQNINTNTVYQTVVTRSYQAIAAGDPCPALSPSFTG